MLMPYMLQARLTPPTLLHDAAGFTQERVGDVMNDRADPLYRARSSNGSAAAA